MQVNLGHIQNLPAALARLSIQSDEALASQSTADAAAAKPDTDDPAYHPPAQLAHLHALRSTLNAAQNQSLAHLEAAAHLGQQRPRNHDFFPASAADWLLRAGTAGLSRRASFLLTVPVAHDLDLSLKQMGVLSGAEAVAPVSDIDRMLMTAQVEALKDNCEAVTALAVADAQAGERYCPLTLQPEKFAGFLTNHRQQIAAVRDACALDGPQRRTALQAALQALAHDYLVASGNLPEGLDPCDTLHVGEQIFLNEPVSLTLVDEPGSGSTFCFEWYGNAAVIVLGIGDLDRPDVDPRSASPTSRLHSEGMEGLSVLQRQAGVYLQKLFIELVHLEEQIHVTRIRNKDGSVMAHARATEEELGYAGSTVLGDSLVSRCSRWDAAGADQGGANDRARSLEAYDRLASLNKGYEATHGAPLLTNAAADNWLRSPAYNCSTLQLHSPAARLQLGGMAPIATLLQETGVLD